MVSNDSPDSQLRSRRIPYRKRVLIAPKDGSERHYGESFDLSLGGMFITTILPLDVGEVADIEMPLQTSFFLRTVQKLLNFYACAIFFKLCFESFCFVFRNAFFKCFRSIVN